MVRAITCLASFHTSEPIGLAMISEREGISYKYLEQLFFKLKRAKIIISQRGRGGGFSLNRNPGTLSLRTVFDAVGEKICPTPCTDPEKGCPRRKTCTIAAIWEKLAGLMNGFLEGTTIQDILENPGRKHHLGTKAPI